MLILIKAGDYNLPSNLYDYKDNIRLRITYSQVDYEVLDCKVINYMTGEIIEDLSEENMNKLFNIEYEKSVTEMNWVDVIKLSELKENEIYKYTANSTIQFPEIENDTGKNCAIYIKQWYDQTYETEINMYKEIKGKSISSSFNEYNEGNSFNIMYKKLGNSELLKMIKEDEIIYLSDYNDGDKLEYKFEKYIYNDTDKNITINVTDKFLGAEIPDSYTIPKGEIYGFDWMIYFATISYSEDGNNQQQTGKTEEENRNEGQNDKQQENENKPTEQTKKDDTQATGKLPYAGESMTMIISVLFVIIIAIIYNRKYYKLKDIK